MQNCSYMGESSVELVTTAMATDGRAVARDADGKVAFVEGALPGETVRAVVTSEKSSFRSAVVETILEPSADRIEPPCQYVAQGCGGCRWQHVELDVQRRLKEAMVLESLVRIGRSANLPDGGVQPTVSLKPWQFRTTLRAGVTAGRPGFRRVRSHDLVAVNDCPVATPTVSGMLGSLRFPGASEVILRAGERTGELMASPIPQLPGLTLPAGVSSSRIHEKAAGRLWRVSAGSFFQNRPDGVDLLASMVVTSAAGLGEVGRAVDLCSGVGVFAGALADAGWKTTAVEVSRSSVADANHNLAGLGVTIERSRFQEWRPTPAELVVADPSRDGMGRAGVAAAVGTGARRVVLISCDVASLGRDSTLLADAGYRVTSVTPIDMFPHTPHVEVLSVFDRRR